MPKEAKDYYHLYYKCPIAIYDGGEPVPAYLEGFDWDLEKEVIAERVGWNYDQIKLLLRPLSDMDEQEKITFIRLIPRWNKYSVITDVEESDCNILFNAKVNDTDYWEDHCRTPLYSYTPEQFVWLLQNRFDIFDLIKDGLALSRPKS